MVSFASIFCSSLSFAACIGSLSSLTVNHSFFLFSFALFPFPNCVSLEEYLHELMYNGEHAGDASMQGVDQGVPVKANFAQAALLLHNSSHVYSRKVEYLYSLVNQQLDSLLAVNSQKKQTSRGRTVDPELEEFREFDPHQEFLLLDDVLPTDKTEDCRHINLPQSRTDQEIFAESGNDSMRGQSLTHATSISATSRTFHTLGVSKILSQINTQSSAELRLMDGQCDLDPSGRLLVPGCQSSTTPAAASARSVESPAGQQEPEYAPNGDFDGDDYDDDGPGFMMGDDDDGNVGGDEENQDNNNLKTHAGQQARKSVTINLDKNQVVQLEERPDPWALLDPHSTDTRKSRPFKLGKTLRVPPGLDDLPADCVSGSHTRKWKPVALPPAPVQAVDRKFFATETYHSLSRKRRLEDDDEENQDEQDVEGDELPMIPLKGLVYGEEFAYLAREHAQRRAAARRQLRREREQQRVNQPAQAAAWGATDHNDNFDDDDDDFGGGYAFGDDDDNDYDAGQEGVDGGSPMVETNTGLQTVDDVYRDAHENGKTRRESSRTVRHFTSHTICFVL